MDFLCIPLHELEGFGGLHGVTGIELPAGQVGQPADEFRIEEESISWLSLIRLGLKRGDSNWTIVHTRGGGVGTSQRQDEYDYGSGQERHFVPHKSDENRGRTLQRPRIFGRKLREP